MNLYIVSQSRELITKLGTLKVNCVSKGKCSIINQDKYIMGVYKNYDRCKEIIKDIMQIIEQGNQINFKDDYGHNEYFGWCDNQVYHMPKE